MKRIFKFSYATLATVVIFVLCYIFSHELLEGWLKGSDSGFNLTYISWLDKFFPNIPFWFPLQGGGVSLSSAYPFFSHLLVVLISRLTPLDLIQSMRILQFLVVPLTSIGIYFYTWRKLKSQTAGLIAGLFYPLSQAAWPWLTNIGLFPQSVAVIYLPWTLLFFDLYLVDKNRWSLVFTAFLIGATFITHFITGLVVCLFLFLYGVFYSMLNLDSGSVFSKFKGGIKAYFKVIIPGLFLAFFWLGPFFAYQQILARNELTFPAAEQVRYMKLMAFLGLSGPGVLDDENLMWYVFIAKPVLILSLVGIFLALLRKNKSAVLWLLLISIFVTHTILPGIWLTPVKLFLFWFGTISARGVLPALILIPSLAAFGALSLSQTLFFFIRQDNVVKNVLSSTCALILIFGLIFLLKGVPPDHPRIKIFSPSFNGYGPSGLDWVSELRKLGLPDKISSQGPFGGGEIKEILSNIELFPQNLSRFDFSPYQGALVGAWNFYNPISQASLYEYASSVNHLMWGYQQEVFYGHHLGGTSTEVDNLSKWLGLSHVVLISPDDPLERFTSSWEEVYSQGRTKVLRSKESQGLVNLTQKRNILVLGQYKKRAYEQIFRIANLGAIPYELALLTEGKDSGLIDEYTPEELNKFSALVLYGYAYKDKPKAKRLLEDFVRAGGRLFIETGWQYVNPDWEESQTEPFFPVARFHWTNFGKSWNIPGFSPPIYKGEPWGVGAANLTDLRNWAEPVVTEGNKVLVARGNFGRGKVVWSGMNLWGHALIYGNQEEVERINSLVSWLFSGEEQGKEIGGVVLKRENPDKVDFSFTISIDGPAFLFFREAFHPYWHAYIEKASKKEEVPIYRAGPEYMLVSLPPLKTDAKVVFKIRKPFFFVVAKLASLFTLIFLLIWAVKPEILSQFISKIPKQKFLFKDFSVMTSWWDREEE